MTTLQLILVADAYRARIFKVEMKAGAGGVPQPTLIEHMDLVHPGRRLRPSDSFTDTRPGSDRAPPGGPGFSYDDHRDAHIAESDRRFAVDIVNTTAQLVRELACRRVLVVAPPRMLGVLRSVTERLVREGAEIDELARELTRLSSSELRDQLAAGSLLATG